MNLGSKLIHRMISLIFMGLIALSGSSLIAVEKTSKERSKKETHFSTWLQSRTEKDLLYFAEDKYPPIQVKVEAITSKHVTALRGTQRKQFPIEELKAIELHRSVADHKLLSQASLEFLKASCEFRLPIWELLDHQELDWIYHYLQQLALKTPVSEAAVEIKKWLKHVPDSEKDLKAFYHHLLTYRMKHFKPVPLDSKASNLNFEKEARYFVEGAMPLPSNFMLHYLTILSKAEISARDELEKENPKWMEDDEIRPQRQRHFHLSIDMSLYPFLFESTSSEQAVEGLKQAAEITFSQQDFRSARHYWRDIEVHYPRNSQVQEIRHRLAALPKEAVKPEPKSTESKLPEEPATSEAPTLQRFNLFEE